MNRRKRKGQLSIAIIYLTLTLKQLRINVQTGRKKIENQTGRKR